MFFFIVVTVVFALAYAKAARIDGAPVWLWVLLSVVASFVGAEALGFIGLFASQIALFVGITLFRMIEFGPSKR